MSETNLRSSVGRWVAEYPQTAEVFETLRIDYGCDGDQTLEEACWKNGLETIRVHSRLQRIIAGMGDETAEDWLHASLSDLCDHIEQTHHAYLKSELSRLTDLIAKVVQRHRAAHPELQDLQQCFVTLRTQLLSHIAREEKVLFPAIRQLEPSGIRTALRIAKLAKPIRAMVFDHMDVTEALLSIRQASRNFARPSDACSKYRNLLQSLIRLETDTHQHIHKENHILFPRVLHQKTLS